MRVTKTQKTKQRPLPLRTVELQKIMSKYLKTSSHKIMETSESLYNKGYISYPRTETDTFPTNFGYKKVLNELNTDPSYKEFAEKLISKFNYPRKGRNNDQAHLPIYPIKSGNGLVGQEKSIYDFVARRFMACISKDAVADEMNVELVFNEEKFVLNGLKVKEKNYLEVYPFDRWENKPIDDFREGELFELDRENEVKDFKNFKNEFKNFKNFKNENENDDKDIGTNLNKYTHHPFKLKIVDGKTSPPQHLTESELITLMDKNGIGTDATIHEHISKIQKRYYAIKKFDKLVPTNLGRALIYGYEKIGLKISYPDLRCKLEVDLKRVCLNEKNPGELLREEVEIYKNVYRQIEGGIDEIKTIYGDLGDDDDKSFKNRFNEPKNRFNGPEHKLKDPDNKFNNKISRDVEDDLDEVLKVVRKNQRKGNNNSIQIQIVNDDTNTENIKNKSIIMNKKNKSSTDQYPECHCRQPSKKGTVSKKGKNHGKIFFSCSKWPNGCDFFQWEDCPREVSIFENDEYKCFCGFFPEMKISNTEKNKGRKFLKCKKVFKPCKFFMWTD